MMDVALDDSKLIYDKQMESIANNGYAPVHNNFPKVRLNYTNMYK